MRNDNQIKTNLFLVMSFLFLFFILYRDFLNLYRIMLDGDFRFYKYYKILLYYKYGFEEFRDYLPVNTRYLGIWISYLIYEFIPCLSINYTSRDLLSQETVCAIYSFALLNYISKISILVLCFSYLKFKLNRDYLDVFLGVIFCQIFLMYVEPSTLDRFCIFYIFLCIYNYNNKFLFRILLVFSFLVNEKILIIFGLFTFINYIILKKDFKDLLSISISCFLYILLIFVLIFFFDQSTHPYYDDGSARFSRLLINPFNKSHLSNSYIPIFFSLIPYIILIYKGAENSKKFEIIIPIFLILLGYGGGENNLGRYAMHSFPLFFLHYVDFFSNTVKKYL